MAEKREVTLPPESPAASTNNSDLWPKHIIGLENGKFGSRTPVATTEEQVDQIFNDHLPAFIRDQGGDQVPVVIWAHGGLVTQEAGFAAAAKQVPWWLANGVYPIYFVWDTGLADTLGKMFNDWLVQSVDVLQPPSPGKFLDWDAIKNALIEKFVRAAGGPDVWTAMKDNARFANTDADGGGTKVAAKLADLMTGANGKVSVHAVGHSAGSIFHSHFIPSVLKQNADAQFESLNLLAPAIRVDQFEELLQPLVDGNVKYLTMFSMKEDAEKRDNCLGLYTHSLLYLIRAALEPEQNASILGLQECVNASLRDYFNSDPDQGTVDAIWSVLLDTPRSSSSATTHGGFSEDVQTLDSIARRVLKRDDVVTYGLFSSATVTSLAEPAHTDLIEGVKAISVN